MKNLIYESTMANNADTAYMINTRTRLLDLERLGRPITIHYHCRRMITPYSCIDTPQEPVTLAKFTLHGGLIYYKKDRFNWVTISMDDIDAIYA